LIEDQDENSAVAKADTKRRRGRPSSNSKPVSPWASST
jgi:hypothetical protein